MWSQGYRINKSENTPEAKAAAEAAALAQKAPITLRSGASAAAKPSAGTGAAAKPNAGTGAPPAKAAAPPSLSSLLGSHSAGRGLGGYGVSSLGGATSEGGEGGAEKVGSSSSSVYNTPSFKGKFGPVSLGGSGGSGTSRKNRKDRKDRKDRKGRKDRKSRKSRKGRSKRT